MLGTLFRSGGLEKFKITLYKYEGMSLFFGIFQKSIKESRHLLNLSIYLPIAARGTYGSEQN